MRVQRTDNTREELSALLGLGEAPVTVTVNLTLTLNLTRIPTLSSTPTLAAMLT